jgi:streptogramin lyase
MSMMLHSDSAVVVSRAWASLVLLTGLVLVAGMGCGDDAPGSGEDPGNETGDVSADTRTDAVEDAAGDPSPDVNVGPDVGRPCPPDPGTYGDPCVDDTECTSGICFDAPGGAFCTEPCVDTCEPLCDGQRMRCRGIEQSSGVLFACQPVEDTLCRGCLDDAQCTSGRCLTFDDGTRACGRDCQVDVDCPTGYTCGDSTEANDGQCVPVTRSCSCTVDTAGLQRPCASENEFGACAGVETCDAELGWSACEADEAEAEVCDGRDNDCDGVVDDGVEIGPACTIDNAFGSCAGTNVCQGEAGYTCIGETATEEVCDGVDNDCDGAVDEGVSNRCGTCGPEPEEVCGDFIDNDCDGAIDEPEAGCFCDGRTNQPCYPGEPQTLGIGACRGGVVSCTCPSGDRFCDDGVYGECVGAVTPTPEVCDGIDNNCDGRIDEGVRNPCGGCGAVPVEVCDGVDNDCDGRIDEGVRNACGQCPGDEAAEVCNGFDDDCDGFVDEGCTCEGDGESCYPGPPATLGVGACAAGIRDCYASTSGTGLCEGAVLPGLEVCNDIDDDCDGRVDVGPTGCSVCGTSPETCNGIDDDCDGFIDEGLRNACGDCLDAVVPEELGGAELCNGFDDDCDGLVDEGLVNACGTCDEVCYVDGFDDDETFNEGEGEGIEIADGIRLNSSSFTFSDIWVANTADDTVTRINTETGAVINTYEVGYNAGRNNDNPSRTAVDFDGNAWVANRAFSQQGSIAKIRGGDCVDDCVEFIVPVGGSNALPRGLAIDTDGNVWVGLDNSRTIVKLSGTNGAQLGSWNVGIRTYGLAIDNRGILWIATIDGGVLGAFDTNTNTYLGAWSGSQCTRPYGIAVDGDGNVWAGNWTCGNVVRLDRASFDRGERPPRFDYYGTGLSNTRGIAVDANNIVWVASSGNDRIARLNRTTGAQLGTTATCNNPIGVGVANDGDVWAVCYGSDRAERFSEAGIVVGNVTVGDQPYSYSDMTGFQLRNFTSPRGTWRTVFDCTFADCAFDFVRFEASTPAGTAVSLRFRTQPPSGPWSAWTASFAASPIDLRGLAPRGQRLEIEVQLSTDANGVSPVLQSFDVEWQRP